MSNLTSEIITPHLQERRIPGIQLLRQSKSLPPPEVGLNSEMIDQMELGSIKSLYMRLVDSSRSDGVNINDEEVIMREYLEGIIPEQSYINHAISWVRQRLDLLKKLYDETTGLAFFGEELRTRVMKSIIDKQRKGSGLPIFNVIVLDLDHLKARNITYGKKQADRTLEMAGEIIRKTIDATSFSGKAEVFAGRKKETGDEFVVVILGDEEGFNNLLMRVQNYSWPSVYLKNPHSNGLDSITVSLRSSGTSSTNFNIDKDTGEVLNEMISFAEKEVDKTGHERNKKNV